MVETATREGAAEYRPAARAEDFLCAAVTWTERNSRCLDLTEVGQAARTKPIHFGASVGTPLRIRRLAADFPQERTHTKNVGWRTPGPIPIHPQPMQPKAAEFDKRPTGERVFCQIEEQTANQLVISRFLQVIECRPSCKIPLAAPATALPCRSAILAE
jgi:hypothetical protein